MPGNKTVFLSGNIGSSSGKISPILLHPLLRAKKAVQNLAHHQIEAALTIGQTYPLYTFWAKWSN
jgi:hypothetical protein